MNLLYDLDGTLSNPLEGIARSLNYTLSKLGREEKAQEDLATYIGPSLETVLSDLLGTQDEALLTEAVRLYRERYVPIGFKENTLYPGIPQLLAEFAGKGCRQFVATSKKTEIAQSVVEHLQLRPYFARVYGAKDGYSRTALIRELLATEGLAPSETVMIGDRSFDIIAGNENGLRTIGVLWGFGDRKELETADADHIVSSVEELQHTIEARSRK